MQLMDGHLEDGRFVTPQPGRAAGCKQLRQQPSRGMDRRDESDQCGGIGHRGDEERQDRPEGGESQGDAKQSTVC